MLPVNRINPAGKVYFAGNGIIFDSDPMWNTISVDLGNSEENNLKFYQYERENGSTGVALLHNGVYECNPENPYYKPLAFNDPNSWLKTGVLTGEVSEELGWECNGKIVSIVSSKNCEEEPSGTPGEEEEGQEGGTGEGSGEGGDSSGGGEEVGVPNQVYKVIDPTQDYDVVHTLTFNTDSGSCNIKLHRGGNTTFAGTVYYRAGTSGAWTELNVSAIFPTNTFPITNTTMQVAHNWNKSGNSFMTPSFNGNSTIETLHFSFKEHITTTIGDYFMYQYAYGCGSLKSMSIPDTGDAGGIGSNILASACIHCSSLEELILPRLGKLEKGVNMGVPSSRLGILKGVVLNEDDLSDWKANTESGNLFFPNTLYSNYIRDPELVELMPTPEPEPESETGKSVDLVYFYCEGGATVKLYKVNRLENTLEEVPQASGGGIPYIEEEVTADEEGVFTLSEDFWHEMYEETTIVPRGLILFDHTNYQGFLGAGGYHPSIVNKEDWDDRHGIEILSENSFKIPALFGETITVGYYTEDRRIIGVPVLMGRSVNTFNMQEDGISLGREAFASRAGVALGGNSLAYQYGVALGYYASASGYYEDNEEGIYLEAPISIGHNSYSNLGISIGTEAASEREAIAIGRQSYAIDASVALGDYAKAEYENSVAVGKNSKTYEEKQVSFGHGDDGDGELLRRVSFVDDPTEDTDAVNKRTAVTSILDGEPTGAMKIKNMVAISETDYDTAETNEELLEDTFYFVIED